MDLQMLPSLLVRRALWRCWNRWSEQPIGARQAKTTAAPGAAGPHRLQRMAGSRAWRGNPPHGTLGETSLRSALRQPRPLPGTAGGRG